MNDMVKINEKRARTDLIKKYFVRLIIAATIIKVWFDIPAPIEQAYGQRANPMAQRQELLQEVQQTNRILQEIKKDLTSKTLKVEVTNWPKDKKTK